MHPRFSLSIVVELKSVQNGGVSGGDFTIPPGYIEQVVGSLGRHH